MNMKSIFILGGAIIFTAIGYVVGLIIGMNIGGNYFPDFVFMSGRGYEATGYLGGIIGAIIGLFIGILLGVKRSNKSKNI